MTNTHFRLFALFVVCIAMCSVFLFAGTAYAGTCEYYDPAKGEDVKKEMTEQECADLGGEYKDTSPTVITTIDFDLTGDGVVDYGDLYHCTATKYALCNPVWEADGVCNMWPFDAGASCDFNGDAFISNREWNFMHDAVFYMTGVDY